MPGPSLVTLVTLVTLARLQQAITMGSLLIALGWACFCWSRGHTGWIWLGPVSLVGSYAAVLAAEFLLLRATHCDDPTPRATVSQLFHAWLGEVSMAPRVFCWRQPFRSARWPNHLPQQAQTRRGVVFIHGFVCNRGLWNPWLQRLTVQGVPFVAVNLQPVFGSIDDCLPCVDAAMRELQRCTGIPPVVVAHSMGGLVARHWWATRAPKRCPPHDDAHAPLVHHVITIGTPHRGTWLARFGRSPNTRQMRQGSRWLQALRRAEPADRAQRFTCFYSHCDNIVFPPSLGTLEGADNRHLTGIAHVQMVDAPEPWSELQHLLQPSVAPAPIGTAGTLNSRSPGST